MNRILCVDDVVFFTARGKDDSEARGLALGALDYL